MQIEIWLTIQRKLNGIRIIDCLLLLLLVMPVVVVAEEEEEEVEIAEFDSIW